MPSPFASLPRVILFSILSIALVLALYWYWPRGFQESDNGESESTCFGTTANGRLEGGVRLPPRGPNFVSYGLAPILLGRTYLHDAAAQATVDAYRNLAESHPETVFKYAETGFASGGRFRPHKTHRNGLSVDFMVPMLDAQGRSVHLPTHPFNRYGYDIEFDSQGRWGDQGIDYEAMGAHLLALDEAARARGIGLWRVIFDPQLQPLLFATEHGSELQRRLQFSTRRSWVRHDEHYHVDFEVPCREM
ncbi:MAG: penicillin-insensitive murein endopeptidase [Acidobacteriota bacterium]